MSRPVSLSRPISLYAANNRASMRLSASHSMPIAAVFAETNGSANNDTVSNGSATGVVETSSTASSSWAQQHYERQKKLEEERRRQEQGSCAC